MLTEFAFTPSIFDEDAHEDKDAWRDQLKELGHNMFPRVSAWPVVVSDLYASSWSQIAEQTVKGIKDPKARILCEGLFQNIRKSLVPRPPCGEWPDDDILWGREAIASHDTECIDRIVSDSATKQVLSAEHEQIRSLDEVEGGGFWSGIASDAFPKMIIKDQVQLLRKLCLHSEWLALINPYTSTNEMDFALELISSLFHRPNGFASATIELHTQEPQNCSDEADRQARIQSVTSNVARQVRTRLKGAQSVSLYFWPEFKERRVIAGTYALDSSGNRQKSPRWGVSMNHVARGSDPDADPTNWSLLRREELDTWFRRYVHEDAVKKAVFTSIKR